MRLLGQQRQTLYIRFTFITTYVQASGWVEIIVRFGLCACRVCDTKPLEYDQIFMHMLSIKLYYIQVRLQNYYGFRFHNLYQLFCQHHIQALPISPTNLSKHCQPVSLITDNICLAERCESNNCLLLEPFTQHSQLQQCADVSCSVDSKILLSRSDYSSMGLSG